MVSLSVPSQTRGAGRSTFFRAASFGAILTFALANAFTHRPLIAKYLTRSSHTASSMRAAHCPQRCSMLSLGPTYRQTASKAMRSPALLVFHVSEARNRAAGKEAFETIGTAIRIGLEFAAAGSPLIAACEVAYPVSPRQHLGSSGSREEAGRRSAARILGETITPSAATVFPTWPGNTRVATHDD